MRTGKFVSLATGRAWTRQRGTHGQPFAGPPGHESAMRQINRSGGMSMSSMARGSSTFFTFPESSMDMAVCP